MPEVLSSFFGSYNGYTIKEYYLDNGNISCSVLDYGCVLRTLRVLDRNGEKVDVVLGYDNLEQYVELPGRMGAVIGRYANRIKNGRFSIDGKEYQLSVNRGNHHIHGGFSGFDKKIWKVLEHDSFHILFCYESADGEEGYPGNLSVMVEYRLAENTLSINYMASSDEDTICNLTNHSYFNLSGKGSIDNHGVAIHSKYCIPTDLEGIPKGGVEKLLPELDMNESIIIHDRKIDMDFILDSKSESAVCFCDASGIIMIVSTDMPAMRLYTGDGLKETDGKNGTIGPRSGICFESQFPVDSPNNNLFNACILRKGRTYCHGTKFLFSSS